MDVKSKRVRSFCETTIHELIILRKGHLEEEDKIRGRTVEDFFHQHSRETRIDEFGGRARNLYTINRAA
jgi:hypothetical protein